MDTLSQLCLALFAVISNAITNRWGFRSTQKMMKKELQNKVDVVTYAAKVKELHDLRNADREELVALRAEIRVLREILQERKQPQ